MKVCPNCNARMSSDEMEVVLQGASSRESAVLVSSVLKAIVAQVGLGWTLEIPRCLGKPEER